jgi:hypothetical protein
MEDSLSITMNPSPPFSGVLINRPRTMQIRSVIAVIGTVAIACQATAAWAVIEQLTPLSQFIADADQILVTKVEKLDPAKPAAWLSVTETLKGKAESERLPVNLKGEKPDETRQLVERLATDQSVILFVSQWKGQKLVFAFSNGTWFQILGRPDGPETRWSFSHLEPYLSRTFKGSTDQLRAVLVEAIAGKKKPPPPNPKEKPGLGPTARPATATDPAPAGE